MKSRVAFSISIAVIVVIGLGIAIFRWQALNAKRRREARYQAVLAMYSRDLHLGADREQVERYIGIHGARPEADPQPLGSSFDDIVVRLGEDPSPWYCSRQVTYLLLKFDDAHAYRGASLKPELQDCM